ncbi:coiled-coil domain-containing protein 186-like isoform X2 [Acropora millepora]|uniref:coiled-coil domain-containing protein 186-like isoform X2 n=1 Tax=Acropora millepora TaxID=45264 RepID=UPI001CF459AE|nr:coiled-coil domain-containing protein 186-like isoform X2 [Acropora millepora]
MSSSLEEVDGNCNLTTDLEEKDSDTTLYDEKVLVNGDACFHDDVEKLNRVRYESEKVLIDNSKNLSSLVNGIKPDNEQELKFILSEYEQTKNELSRLQTDYKLSLEREKSLGEKLHDYQYQEDSSVHELSRLNEDLRTNLDAVVEELNSTKEDLRREKESYNELAKERDILSLNVSQLQVNGSEETKELKKSRQQFEDELKKRTEELTECKEKLHAHDQAAKRAIAALQKEMELRIDQVTKMYDDMLKEKENLGIKLVQGEEEKKKTTRENELLVRKISENGREIEKFRQKLKSVQTDHNKLQASHEDKVKELVAATKESDRLSEELNSQAVKVKWAQNKLKTELEAHKETKTKLSQVTQKLKEAKEEGLQIRNDCQAMIKKYQESEEMRSNSLDNKLRAKEVELKRHEQEIADQDEVHKMKMQELEQFKEQWRNSQEELKVQKAKISSLEEKVTHYALKVAEHEKNALLSKKEHQNLKKELEEHLLFKEKYESEMEMVKHLKAVEMEQKRTISELEADILACHSKEAELLAFSEKMTAKNAQLQSEATGNSSKLDVILLDKLKLEEQYLAVETAKKKLEQEMKEKISELENEIKSLTIHLEEKSKAVSELTCSLEESLDELQVLKRKNTAHIRDLTRQLQQARKQVEKFESNGVETKENASEGSKSSSTNSLDKLGSSCTSPISPSSVTSATDGGWVIVDGSQSSTDRPSLEAPSGDSVQILPQSQKELAASNTELEPNKAMLVERICRLQKIHAKKNEKLEFMEEHVSALVDEIQKKSKIIQYYVVREQAGTLAPPRSDLHKAQVARHGGIMASVYSSKAVDPDMTLDLSLEINRKLQAVLEDTILKNITLKENLDTLGDEITRLNGELQTLKRNRRS